MIILHHGHPLGKLPRRPPETGDRQSRHIRPFAIMTFQHRYPCEAGLGQRPERRHKINNPRARRQMVFRLSVVIGLIRSNYFYGALAKIEFGAGQFGDHVNEVIKHGFTKIGRDILLNVTEIVLDIPI